MNSISRISDLPDINLAVDRECKAPTGFPRYREFGKGPGISKTVFPVMKRPGICNFHHFSVNRPGIWFALEMSVPERSVRFKAANK